MREVHQDERIADWYFEGGSGPVRLLRITKGKHEILVGVPYALLRVILFEIRRIS